MKYILSLLLLVMSLGVQAQSPTTLKLPSCSLLNLLWKTRYHKALKVSWKLKTIACTGPSRDRALAETAYILEKTQFRQDSLPEGIAPLPQNMLSFITSKYNQIRMNAYKDPWTDIPNKIIYFNHTLEKENGFTLIGNLIHESRHADGNHTLHVACHESPQDFICDSHLGYTMDSAGPHTNGFIYFAWIVARSNWPQEWKDLLRNLTLELLHLRLNVSLSEREFWINTYLSNW